MGTVIVVAVGVAILSFVLADMLGPQSSLFGGQDNSVGEIAGQNIQAQEYQNVVDLMTQKFNFRNGRRPNDAESGTVREQAWERLIGDIAFGQEFQELGVQVTREEEIDMVQGKNVHPQLVAAFTNPETGDFDPAAIVQFLSNLSAYPPETQAAWYSMEDDILSGRRRVKYDNLLVKSTYSTQEESKLAYRHQTEVAEVNYLYIPYYTISDSLVTVSDKELRDYLTKHASEYQVDESRSMKYVTFPVNPSAEDSTEFQQEMELMKRDFNETQDDSLFAVSNSESQPAYFQYTVDAMPLVLQSDYENLAVGSVYGPFMENGMYHLYKITGIIEDTIFAANARHILFKGADNSIEAKAEAKAQAEEVLAQIKAGADFAEMARQHGTDGTAARGGDLGWFRTGAMVPEFQDAVFSVDEPGLLPKVVESEFGYHIIEVVNAKTNKKFAIATVSRELLASEDSRDEAFRKADYFAGTSDDLESFEANAVQQGINVYDATDVDKNARRFGTLGNARQVVSWLYREGSPGEVSEVFDINNNYVVAVMTEATEEGLASLEKVRTEITAKVKNQKKAEIIKERLSGIEGDLNQMAAEFGEDAEVLSSSDLQLSSNSLPNVGFAPKAVGMAFGMEPGERSDPIETDNGMVVLETVSITPAPEIADYSQYRQQLNQQKENQTSFGISETVKEFSDIEDKRYKFY